LKKCGLSWYNEKINNEDKGRLEKHLMDIKRMMMHQLHWMKKLIKYIMYLGKPPRNHLQRALGRKKINILISSILVKVRG